MLLLIMCCDLEVTDRRMTPAIKLIPLLLDSRVLYFNVIRDASSFLRLLKHRAFNPTTSPDPWPLTYSLTCDVIVAQPTSHALSGVRVGRRSPSRAHARPL